MTPRKAGLHRLIAQVLVFSLAAEPFALAQTQAHRLRAQREATASFVAPAAELTESGAEAASCADDLTQRRAPLVSLVETLLWPPNHSLVDVGLGVNVTAPCEGRVTTRVAVFADEPDEDLTGDGNVPGDARLDGTTLYLRSERKGDGDGRVYLVLTTSTLPDGTSGTACATVTVPRSRSKADLAGVSAQASAARAYCDAHLAPPASYFKLTEGVLTLANVPPVVDAGPDQAVDFPGSAALQGTATDDGRPNKTLSVSWSKVAGPGTVTFSSPGTAETTASFSATGTYTLRLTANDGQLTESDDVVVVVSIANEAPHVDAGPDREIMETTVSLDGSATDDGRPAGSTLATTWSVASPAGAAVTFADVHAVETTATLPGVGEYVLRLTADDGQFAVSDDVRIIVHALPPPVLGIEDAAVPEGHEGTTAAAVTLALSHPWSQPVTVDYMTEDGTAVAGCDYRTSFGTVTFAPGETTAEILVPIAGELAPEEDETVRIRVDNVSQASLERTEATLTIRNDDAANRPPGALSNRTPADRAHGVALPPTLTWSAADPDAGDVLTHDVHLGTSFATAGQSWARACPASQGPGPRTAPVSGYDEAGDRLILFGGLGTTDGSLWILANASAAGGPPQWTSVPTSGGPVGLGRAASVYDAATNRLFVVGGCTGGCVEGSDRTWILTNANGLGGTPTWSLLAGAGPGPRMDHAVAIDPGTRRLIVFGGWSPSGTAAGAPLGDVRLLSGLDGQPVWQELPAQGAGPARSGMTASYDRERNVLVVFGGRAGAQALADAWVLEHANGSGGSAVWSRLTPAGTAPPGRWGHVAAYDPVTARLVVYGGRTASANPATRFVFRDVWMLTEAAGGGAPEWIRLSPSTGPAGPAGHAQAAGAFSNAENRLVVVGGASSTAPATDEVWVLSDAVGTLPLVSSDTAASLTPDGLVPGAMYHWRVVSRDDHGAVRGSAVWRFTSNPPLPPPQPAGKRTWTTARDFAEGQSLHVNGDGDRVQLDGTAGAYPFVWIAVSSKGTIVKIDARTGAILGEYYSSPNGQPRNPSRTTVDLNGNVWTGNRDGNSIVHIGNEENGQCVDRNGNGVIDTSRAFGDLRPWTNAGGADTDGGISTAADECILHYTRVSAPGTRHLSVTRDNDIWVSGSLSGPQPFDLVDGRTGFIKRSEPSIGYGGYGGLIDRNGVIWSARPLLRWDPALPLSGPNGGNWKGFGHDSYGLCIDPQGNVWETALYGAATAHEATNGTLRKWAPDGTLLGTFGHGYPNAQGCAVDARGHVWVAHVLWGRNTVGHVKNDGTYVGSVTVPSGPTGVAVDLDGKIWTSNHNSQNVSRIDPNAGPIGADGITRIGAVDFTTPNLGGIPYNYSDMTGSALVGAPREGRWSVVFDSETADARWGLIRWSESRCGDGSLSVRVASSLDGLTFTADQPAASGQGMPVPDGRYLRVTVTFTRATTGESPVLYDLSVGTAGYPVPGDDAVQPPQADAGADQSVEMPNEASLSGSACDDGRPSGALDVSWSKVSGPGDVRFSDPAQPKTRARFKAAGSFDAVEDFSETTNPSGPWSYGWKPTRTGTFTAGVPAMCFGMPCWLRTKAPDAGGGPVVAKGPRGQTYSFASNVLLPAELLDLHPGVAGQNAVVRWTAPAAGSYRIDGRFQGISTNNPTVDVAILHNATAVFTGDITSFGQAAPFALVRDVAAGDVVDFSVGFGNGSYNSDSTGLAVRVVPVDATGAAGTYVLRLSAGDAAGGTQDDVTVTVTTPECAAPPAGTVGWWPADGLATDLLGGPSATLAGGMGYGAGMVGQAFLFDGVDDAATVPAAPALAVQALTLEGWVFPTDPRVERPIFEYGSPGVIGVHLWQNLNTAVQRTPGALYANLIDAGGSNHVLGTRAGVLVPSTWNHVALTYDPASGKARLYANGRLEVEFGAGAFVPKTNLPFNIGQRPGSSFRFAGRIDEATVVGRALTAAEIQEIYFAGALGKCKAADPGVPSVDAGPDQRLVHPQKTAVLDATVTDDGQPSGELTTQWSVAQKPAGATVAFADATAVDTTATFSAEGTYDLRLTANDGQSRASDDLTIVVEPPVGNVAPVVDAGPDGTLTLPANSLTLTGTATDDGLPLDSTLSFRWSVAAGSGVVTFGTPAARETTATFSDPGVYVLKLTVSDSALTGSDQVSVTVQGVAPVGNPPTVAITSPPDGATVVERVDIVGSAESATLASWRLEHRLTNDSTWTRFAGSTEPLAGGVLAVFDPTLLLNGIYEVRLVATDISGRSTSTSFTVVVKGEQKVGLFTLSFVDLEVPVSGLPIRVVRSYDSRDKRNGDFGVGWRMDITSVNLQESGIAGLHWDGTKSGGFFPTYCLEPSRPHSVTFTLPDGRVQEFEMALEPSCQAFAPPEVVQVAFRPVEDTVGSLAPVSGGEVWAVGSWPGPVELYDGDTFELYDPELYRYTSPEGDVLIVHESGGLQSITDANGNRLVVTAAGIQHSSGKSIGFVRDALGRVTSVTDPAGNAMTYRYDGRGDLVAFTDRESETTSFTYDDSHGLVDIEDPHGVRVARNEYDAQGRLVRHIDAFGKVIELSHDLDARRQVITDRLGHTQILEYDPRGNVVREVDAAGGVTLRTYDSRDNKLSETDPNGNTTTFTYDAQDNLLTERDPLGNTVVRTYDARRQMLTLTDARGKVTTTNTYDANHNLLKTRDALGQETLYTYDAAGNMLTSTDPLGCVTRYEYDAFGNVTKETNALGHATTYTYDANGNRLSETRTRTVAGVTETLTTAFEHDKLGRWVLRTYPDGRTVQPTYDAMGRRLATIDRLGRETRSELDEMGRVIRLRFPDGFTGELGYDDEGRVVSTRDRAGRLTSYTYDGLGRLLTTTYPDSTSETDTYDAGGRLTSMTDATGATTRYEYDAAGRETKVVDPLGHRTETSYDANGNVTAVRDPNGQTTAYEYDDLSRRVRTVFPDGTEERITYDAMARIASRTDPAGRTTRFTYDCLGQLLSVTDALGQVTSHSYDQIGDRVSQTDANGRTTTFEYDRMRHPRRRTLPDGATEATTFDTEGNLVSRTDFLGRSTSYTYDVNDRLTERRYPDGTRVTFTYTPTDKRASATDARGTTLYGYDVRDRMISALEPDGRKLEYAYDGEGRRTRLTATVGAEALVTNYAYDAAGRLLTVTDPLGRASTHGYDANGNRVSLAQPNGTATAYSYNALNRLESLTTTRPGAGGPIQSYALTLGPAGNRQRITEHDGTVREYAYDELYRLTRETVRTPLGLLSDDSFRYDPVGNRIERTRTDASGTVTTPSSYDSRDRLLSAGGRTFGWDDNGNLVSHSGGATYVWDFDQRLREVRSAEGTVVEEAYDADGNRVEVRVTPPTGPPTLTRYLVDATCTLCQIVAESDAAGRLTAYYVRGNDLLSVMRPDGAGGFTTRFYHADALGSVRRLTDEAGNLTDGYTYTAFGELSAHTGSDPQPFAFAGEPYDPNIGFYQNRARWLDPESGRFASPDPLLGHSSDPQSLHQYTYAHLDPVNRTDPSGLATATEQSGTIGIQTIVSATSRPAFLKIKQQLLKGVVCNAGKAALDANLKARDGHHSLPKFMGAKPGQYLIKLDVVTHRLFHSILHQITKVLGLPGGAGGKGGSRTAWTTFFTNPQNVGQELVALSAVWAASEIIDKACKFKGKNSLRYAVTENLKAGGLF